MIVVQIKMCRTLNCSASRPVEPAGNRCSRPQHNLTIYKVAPVTVVMPDVNNKNRIGSVVLTFLKPDAARSKKKPIAIEMIKDKGMRQTDSPRPNQYPQRLQRKMTEMIWTPAEKLGGWIPGIELENRQTIEITTSVQNAVRHLGLIAGIPRSIGSNSTFPLAADISRHEVSLFLDFSRSVGVVDRGFLATAIGFGKNILFQFAHHYNPRQHG